MYNFFIHRLLGVAHRLYLVADPAPMQASTTFVFIHGIGSSHKMWRKVQQDLRLLRDFNGVRFVSIDLLGFGKSPRPDWATYDTIMQAKSLYKTLRHITGSTKVVLIGHSLGSLVAVEYAKLYRAHVERLILCSPPFYRQQTKKLPTKSAILYKAYEEFAKNPARSERLLLALQKYDMINEGYSVDKTNAPIFLKTLKSSIMNQTAYDDAFTIGIPTIILSGRLDPVVIDSNITQLAKQNQHITRKRIALAAHEINPVYRKELVATLSDTMRNYS